MNVASEAGTVIQTDDCTLVDHFRTTNQTMADGPNNYWVFGYFHTDDYLYYCSRYIWGGNAGTLVGETNSNSTRRLICPCSLGK